jgi:hypothetical protein
MRCILVSSLHSVDLVLEPGDRNKPGVRSLAAEIACLTLT